MKNNLSTEYHVLDLALLVSNLDEKTASKLREIGRTDSKLALSILNTLADEKEK